MKLLIGIMAWLLSPSEASAAVVGIIPVVPFRDHGAHSSCGTAIKLLAFFIIVTAVLASIPAIGPFSPFTALSAFFAGLALMNFVVACFRHDASIKRGSWWYAGRFIKGAYICLLYTSPSPRD